MSLYDTTTGEEIPVSERIGLLDRKLRIVGENTEGEEEWVKWALKAYKATYGYEFQGDSLLLARENLLYSFLEYYHKRFSKFPEKPLIDEVATIISWNIWQMDGLKFVVPYSCVNEVSVQLDLFGDAEETLFTCPGCQDDDIRKHNGIHCKIKDWSKNKVIEAVMLL